VPASAANVVSGVHLAGGDFGRSKQVLRPLHPVGNSPGEELLVVVEFLFVGVASRSHGCPRRVRVGGRDHDVLRWDAAPLLNQPSRLDTDAAVKSNQIDHNEGERRFAVVQHEATRV
jgi:hypothetical protein